jgi:hypothetical protein
MMSASDRRATRRLWVALLSAQLAVGIASFATPAGAQSAGEKETARSLVDSGRDKRKSGDRRGALADFQAAHAIMKVPTTGIEVGRTQADLGLLVEARDTLLEVQRSPVTRGEPAPYARARAEAKSLASALASRIPSVKLNVSGGPAGEPVSVTVDDVAVSSEMLAAPYKLNPGKHAIVAKRGTASKRVDIDLPEGETREVAVELSASTDSAPAAPPVKPAPAPAADGADASDETRTNPLVYVGAGVAAAGLVVGSITGIMAISSYSDAAPSCSADNRCPLDVHDDIDAGQTAGTISTIAFVVAGAGAATAVIGLLMPVKVSAGSNSTSLVVGPGFVGARGRFF